MFADISCCPVIKHHKVSGHTSRISFSWLSLVLASALQQVRVVRFCDYEIVLKVSVFSDGTSW
jgi:hypothetical protein